MFKRCKPAAGACRIKETGDRREARYRRQPGAPDPAIADGKCPTGVAGRSGRHGDWLCRMLVLMVVSSARGGAEPGPATARSYRFYIYLSDRARDRIGVRAGAGIPRLKSRPGYRAERRHTHGGP